jgi:hypothetical protein
MLNLVRWPLSYVQGESLKGSGGDSVRLLNHRALGPLSRSTEQCQTQNTTIDTPPTFIAR